MYLECDMKLSALPTPNNSWRLYTKSVDPTKQEDLDGKSQPSVRVEIIHTVIWSSYYCKIIEKQQTDPYWKNGHAPTKTHK